MKIVKTLLTSLASPFGSADTQLTLTKLTDSKGNTVSLSNFGSGSWLVVVLKSGTTTEMVKCNSLANNADGTVTIGIATSGRDLNPTFPYAGGSTGQDFPAGTDVIITNDPYTMSHFVDDEEDHTIAGLITFSQVPQATQDPIGNNDLTRKSYVASLVLGTLTTIDVIVPGTAGATVAAGKLVYFDDASNEWKLADATSAATVNNVLLGIAQGAGTAGVSITGGILLQGVDTHQSALTDGQTMYASDTPGAISNSAGTVNVAIGISKGTTQLYFDPRFNQQLTNDQLNALAGTSGTPSSSNKFVTSADVSAAAVADKIIRASGVFLPALDGSNLLNVVASSVRTSLQAAEAITGLDVVAMGPYQSDGGILLDTSGAQTSNNFSITIGNNANRMLVAFVQLANSAGTITGVQFNGVAMTSIDTVGAGGNGNGSNNGASFILPAPSTGAHSLVVSVSGGTAKVTYYSIYNAAQSTTPDAHVGSAIANSGAGVSITTVANGAIVFGAMMSGSSNAVSGTATFENAQSVSTAVKSWDSSPVFPAGTSVGIASNSADGLVTFGHYLISIAPATVPATSGGLYRATAATAPNQYWNKYQSVVGLAPSSISAAASGIVVHGGTITGLSGLRPGFLYYLSDTAGQLSTSAGTNSRKVGIALSTTTLLITNEP